MTKVVIVMQMINIIFIWNNIITNINSYKSITMYSRLAKLKWFKQSLLVKIKLTDKELILQSPNKVPVSYLADNFNLPKSNCQEEKLQRGRNWPTIQ